ncbi:MAG: hypothetical protein IPK03_10755 [Bacteroidetes bacterium]|nr:hypothetical protein [Bacteroidota bacterium]
MQCSETVDCHRRGHSNIWRDGYSAENSIESGYRDSRILRIYEGTNEINRMLAYGELMKRAFKNKEIDIPGEFKKIPWNLLKTFRPFQPKTGLTYERSTLRNIKNTFLLLGAITGSKLKEKLIDEQEIVMNLSDILAECYIAESALLRIEKLRQKFPNDPGLDTKYKLFQIYLYEAVHKVRKSSYDAINSFSTGIERRIYISLAKNVGSYLVNAKTLRREVVAEMIQTKIW